MPGLLFANSGRFYERKVITMLYFKCTKEQRKALEGLAYWVADENYIRERFGENDPDIKTCHDTITKCIFPECDRLNIPFWVQNSVICIGENWRKYKEFYFSTLLAEKNIYV